MPRVLVLTGMHRSGTSLLSSLALRAGIDMGSVLMPAGRGNRRGHFEDLEIHGFHERFLERREVSPFALPEDWSPDPTAAEEEEARELVARRADRPLWGFKDPRATLFLDFWDGLLAAPLFLLVYRHPVEVALSLLRRGLELEVQHDPRIAFRAWTNHNERLLAFRQSHPERCLLWNVAGATRSLAAAAESLEERLDVRLERERTGGLYHPDELHRLQSREIDWPALLPEELALYGRLEDAAELPGRDGVPGDEACAGPERELVESNEHLLAAALRTGTAGGAVAASAAQRSDYTRLRLVAAQQEEDVRKLREQLRAAAEERTAIESSSALRAVRLYWTAVQRARIARLRLAAGLRRQWFAGLASGPPRAGECLVGCVAENDPRSLAQAVRLVRSIRWFGGTLARVLVCVVVHAGSIDPGIREDLEALGAEVRAVQRLDARNPSADKLRFFEEARGSGAAFLLLLDCDMAVVRDPLPLLARGLFQATIADLPTVPHEVFERIFPLYDLPLPARRYRTTFDATPTIPYCNAGLIAMPAALAVSFVPVWRDYGLRLARNLDVLGPAAPHCTQASLSLALAAHPVPFRAAPLALNLPLHLTSLDPPEVVLATDPAILHYHEEVGERGFLLPSPYPLAQKRIAALNRRLAEERGRLRRTG